MQQITTQKKTQTCISEVVLFCCQMQNLNEDPNCEKKISPEKLDKNSVSSCVCLHGDNQCTCKHWIVDSWQKSSFYNNNNDITFTVLSPGLSSSSFIQCAVVLVLVLLLRGGLCAHMFLHIILTQAQGTVPGAKSFMPWEVEGQGDLTQCLPGYLLLY